MKTKMEKIPIANLGRWFRLVTSPYYRDFYLQSHSAIKGTARPTHHFVLRNDVIRDLPSHKVPELVSFNADQLYRTGVNTAS